VLPEALEIEEDARSNRPPVMRVARSASATARSSRRPTRTGRPPPADRSRATSSASFRKRDRPWSTSANSSSTADHA
jgi:hypothetical protein